MGSRDESPAESAPTIVGTDEDATLPVEDLPEGGDADTAAMFRVGGFAERYRQGQLLGLGGMGEVRGVGDRATGRTVAMKTIRRDRENATVLRRFAREARIQAQLEHPSIVPVYDVGVNGEGDLYFTMKRVRGESLDVVLLALRRRDPDFVARYSQRKLLAVLSNVAMTLEYAHRRGVVHRDLKPSNIMLGGFGEVYVLDWGLADVQHGGVTQPGSSPALSLSALNAAVATPSGGSPLLTPPQLAARAQRLSALRAAAAEAPLVDSSQRPDTVTGQVLGTPGYVAPEQLSEGERGSDHRCDVYALGVMLFEILTLQRLHTGTTVAKVFESTLAMDGASPRARTPERDVPPELDALCEAALRRDPAQRTSSAGGFARALEAYLDGDRDLEQRRVLAARSAEAAAKALARSHEPGADENAARSVALREVVTALGLDPGSAPARATLVRLLTEPGRGAERAAEDANREAATRSFRMAARNAIYAMFTYLLYVPIVLWMGVRSWWMLGMMAAAIVGVIGVTYHYYRRPPPDLRLPLPHLLMTTISLGTGVVLLGPFVLLPTVVMATGVAYVASVSRRLWLIAGASTLVVLAPLALQLAGVIPPSYDFQEGTLRILPGMTELPEAATLVFLALTHVVVIVATLVFVWRLRRNYLDAERRLRVQAWQLGQIVPEDTRSLITQA